MTDQLAEGMGQLHVSGHGKKKRARAFHTDLMEQRPTYPGAASDPNQAMPAPIDSTAYPAHSPLAPPYQQSPIPQIGNTTGPAPPAQGSFVPVQEAASAHLSVQEFRDVNHREYMALEEYTDPTTGEPVQAQRQFLTFANVAPPDATTQYLAVDQGTASAKFMRSTMYYVPETEQLRAATKLPLAVTIRPFAPLSEVESPVPVVDMRRIDHPSDDPLDNGPIRCRRCRAYVNPSMQFSQSASFTCNICQFPNNRVPDDYHAMLDVHNQRIDKFVRPELHRGVYDLLVPKEYHAGFDAEVKDRHGQPVDVPPPQLHQVFLVDVSEASIRQGLPQVVADAIRAAVFGAGDDPIPGKVALMTFDKKIHFYNVDATADTTEEAIVVDLDDPSVPFYQGLFGDATESRDAINDALAAIEQIGYAHDVMPDAEPCFASALKAASMALALMGGGKITAVLSALSSWGPGALKFKDNRNVGRNTSDTDQKVYLPDNDYWLGLSKQFRKDSVGLDVHVVAPAAVDLSHVGWLAASTGGTISRVTHFSSDHDARALAARIHSSVRKVRGTQGQLKLRCSNGLQVTQYYSGYIPGGANMHTASSDPKLPAISEDFTMTVLLEYDGKLSTKYDCHFQAALLYTDPEGVRKVRVINLVLAVTERLEEAFNFADENAVVTTIARDCLSFVGKQPLIELRESINLKLVEVFTQYRAMSEYGSNRNRTLSTQLLFPDSIKHLPQFLLSLIKTRALRASTSLSVDSRLGDVYTMLNMPIERLMYHLYPALVEIHSLADEDGTTNETGCVRLPKFKDLSVANLESGVYLLCDGSKVMVWVDPQTNPMLLKDLFGTENIGEIDARLDELPELDTDISKQTATIIKFFNQFIIGCPSLGAAGVQLVRPGYEQQGEIEFKEKLVEDSLHGTLATSSGPSYPEYLSSLHKAIRDRLDNDKSSQKVRQSVTQGEQSHETLAQRMIHF
ncbi:hypothetical protein DIURU_001355 [Diutina rugosa]|uniref:VWFA domain-containing protein n=1 Tax=Diutina rugosa TaxID=5481 RepID=A0A642UUL5_DIURU|nr:uncharacterized protein DIURU_001355 [Diutina rugosa]KAA8905819.1 hypothetical protein DIURU_001355 [Diutina rugosa]